MDFVVALRSGEPSYAAAVLIPCQVAVVFSSCLKEQHCLMLLFCFPVAMATSSIVILQISAAVSNIMFSIESRNCKGMQDGMLGNKLKCIIFIDHSLAVSYYYLNA